MDRILAETKMTRGSAERKSWSCQKKKKSKIWQIEGAIIKKMASNAQMLVLSHEDKTWLPLGSNPFHLYLDDGRVYVLSFPPRIFLYPLCGIVHQLSKSWWRIETLKSQKPKNLLILGFECKFRGWMPRKHILIAPRYMLRYDASFQGHPVHEKHQFSSICLLTIYRTFCYLVCLSSK